MQRHYPLNNPLPVASVILTALYALVFVPLYARIGYGVGGLVVLPVLLVGWGYGLRAGLWAGVTAFVLNALLFTAVGQPGWTMMLYEGAPGIIAVIAIGVTVGHLHDQVVRLTQQVRAAHEALEQERATHTLLASMPVMCAACKRLRETDATWVSVEAFFAAHSTLRFSHGICDDCLHRLYGDLL